MSLRKVTSSGVKFAVTAMTLSTFVNFNAVAQDVSDGFNYPIGPRNPGIVTPSPPDGDGWRVATGFQEFDPDPATNGFHSGDDWNDECGGTNDVGAPVYAVANGEVVDFKPYGLLGDVLVLKHNLGPEGIRYSLYLHIDVQDDLLKGQDVGRDQQIGVIANVVGLAPHLHFEIRTKPVDFSVLNPATGSLNLWPGDDDVDSNNAYYNGFGAETLQTKMDNDGLIQPGEFIDAHRPDPSDLERGRIPSSFTFDRDLPFGTCRHEVQYLQNFLNLDRFTRVANVDEVGSLGNETSNVGAGTREAVKKFQQKYLGWTEFTPSYGSVLAPTRDEINRILRESRARPNVDIALMIDSSGSMQTNDPDNARLDAARAYLTASFAGDYVGVVDFDSSARILSGARQLPEDKAVLQDAIRSINSIGGTNIGLGIQKGCELLIASTSERHLIKGAIMLTDGQGGSSRQRECFEKRRWPIYTFGLGDNVDDVELEEIAKDTGGEYTPLPTNSLVCEFVKVRAKIAGTEAPGCVIFLIQQGAREVFNIELPAGLLQANFNIDWLGSDVVTTLTDPTGRAIDRNTVAADVTHDKGETFEIFTIANPQAGVWEVELFGADIPPDGEEVTFGYVSVPAPDTLVPGPDDLAARAKSGKVSLYWTHLQDATSYKIYRSESAGGPHDLIASGHVTSYATYLDESVTNGTTYYYVVSAIIDGVESNPSNEASATPTSRTRR